MRISDWSSDVCSSDLLPSLEVDARIDNGIHDVADDVHQQAQQGEEVERAEHHRVVAVERRLEAEQPQPVQREDHLDEQRATEQHAHQGSGETGDDQQNRIANNVAVKHPPRWEEHTSQSPPHTSHTEAVCLLKKT